LKKSRTPIFTEKISVTTMTTMITTKKSKRWNMNWIEAKKETPKSLIKLIRDDNRPVKLLAAVVNTGAKDNLGRAGDKGSGSSTRCGTRRSVVTITRVGDQTVDPNRITTPFEPYTPRTRTQRWSTTIGTSGPRKIWKCVDEEIEDEPATDLSNTIRTLWNDITLPTRLPKYPTPVDPVTKWFLKMTSTYRWRRRPTDKCTKAYVALREAQAMDWRACVNVRLKLNNIIKYNIILKFHRIHSEHFTRLNHNTKQCEV